MMGTEVQCGEMESSRAGLCGRCTTGNELDAQAVHLMMALVVNSILCILSQFLKKEDLLGSHTLPPAPPEATTVPNFRWPCPLPAPWAAWASRVTATPPCLFPWSQGTSTGSCEAPDCPIPGCAQFPECSHGCGGQVQEHGWPSGKAGTGTGTGTAHRHRPDTPRCPRSGSVPRSSAWAHPDIAACSALVRQWPQVRPRPSLHHQPVACRGL